MHSVVVGQDTPLSSGVLPPTTCCAFHVTPPLVVASITVAPLAGAGLGPADTDGPTAPGGGARQRSEVARAAGSRLTHRQGGALGLTEDARTLLRTRVPGKRTARRGESHGAKNQEQAATASPDTPVVKHGSWKHGTTTIAVGAAFPRSPFDTLAAVDWVDLLIIGLMLLAAVHGLRLGALVQLLTFGGFFLGFLLGTVIWVPLLSSGHHRRCDPFRLGRVAGPFHRLCPGVRRARHRHLEQCHGAPASPGQRRCRPGRRGGRPGRPALRLDRGGRDPVPQQPVHVARRRREPFGHPPLHRRGVCPRPPPSSTTCRPS